MILQTRFFLDMSIIMTFGMYVSAALLPQIKTLQLKANFVKWQSAMARELLNANGISKSKAS